MFLRLIKIFLTYLSVQKPHIYRAKNQHLRAKAQHYPNFAGIKRGAAPSINQAPTPIKK